MSDPAVAREGDAPFFIGSWAVHPTTHELSSGPSVRRLEPKAFKVLMELAEVPGEVRTREYLLDAVWPDVVVGEGTLSRCVSQLRKAFGDSAESSAFIETVPRVGYRLVAPVTRNPASAPDRSRIRWPSVLLTLLAVVCTVGIVLFRNPGSHDPVGSPSASLDVHPLTSLKGMEHSGVLSNEGDRIAFVHTGNLHVISISDTESVPEPVVVPGVDRAVNYPAWSPDDLELAYLECTPEGTCDLVIRTLESGVTRIVLTGIQAPWGLSWSPDGSLLAYSAREEATDSWSIHAFQRASGRVARLTNPAAAIRGDIEPAWSRDGKRLLFKRSVGEGVGDLWVLDTDTSELTRLTHDDTGVVGADWMPGDSRIVFSSNRSGLFRLYFLDIATGEIHPANAVPARDPARPRVSRDGRRMIYEEWSLSTDIVDRQGRSVVASTWLDGEPALSPTGDRVVFVSNRMAVPELWLARRDGTREQRLVAGNGHAMGAPSWSPDGRRVAFEWMDKGQRDIYVVDVAMLETQRLTHTDANERTPQWSISGSHIWVGRDGVSGWQVQRIDATSGRADGPYRIPGRMARERPDGRGFIVGGRTEEGLYWYPSPDADPVRISDGPAHADWANWAVTEDAVMYLDRTHGHVSIVRHDLSSGSVRVDSLTTSNVLQDVPAITFSADGQDLLYSRTGETGSDIMMVYLHE